MSEHRAEPTDDDATREPSDGRVRRGDRTRRVVLGKAVNVASVEGLEGLSIGRLATELSMSKSGLIAHFGTKEGLQLATIRAARAIFVATVIDEALETPPVSPGCRPCSTPGSTTPATVASPAGASSRAPATSTPPGRAPSATPWPPPTTSGSP